MEIDGENPKAYQYIKNLVEHDPESWKLWTGGITWAKDKLPFTEPVRNNQDFSDSDRVYSKYELTDIIGTKGGDWEYRFLDSLEDEGILEHVGKRDGTDIFVFTHNWKKKLGEEIEPTEKFQEARPFIVLGLKHGEGKELL
ncbi:hypothetical protein [Halorarum halobium]|uniref:hypothetical protein n=1 Tax=Halorarum halobium TaxID=3075121 RepID=UPI0028ABAA46|nr:hypothetical protein [Halobaculum sp. XH14]